MIVPKGASVRKISFKMILSYYLSTLQSSNENGARYRISDLMLHCVLPIALGIGCTIFGFTLKSISNLIAGVAIVSALLGAVSVFLFQTRVQLYDRMNSSSETGTIFNENDVNVLDELFFSVLWAILEGMFICAVLIICDCADVPNSEKYWMVWCTCSGVVIVVAGNLVVVLLMCLKRMARLYERFGMHKSKDSLTL